MQSKKSFFNKTLFLKNLSRFWPLWGGVSLLGSLLPLYMLLELLQDYGNIRVSSQTLAEMLYTVTALAVPTLSFGYAVLCAMLVWNYLYSTRSVGLMHTLPVDRTCLFVTSALSGLAMMLIPYAIVGTFTCLIALFFGFFDLTAVCFTIAGILLMTVTFFGMATFFAMLTGHVFALPVLYLLGNFLAPLLEALAVSLTAEFLLGVNGSYQGITRPLSPLLQLYSVLSVEIIRDTDGAISGCYLAGFGTLFLYGLAGLVLLGLGWLLYRRRPSESAGDVAAFRMLRPVFRWGLALLSALTLGWLLYELFWASFHTYSIFADPVPMAVCMALTGLLGWYVASMLLEKSLRVFRGTWKSAIAVCVSGCVLCALLSVDIFGLEDRVPDFEDVSAVNIVDYDLNTVYYTEDAPEMVEKILNLHHALISDKAVLRSEDSWNNRSHSLRLTYTLKNGTSLTRQYFFAADDRLIDDLNTFSGQLAALYRNPQMVLEQFTIPASGSLTSMSVYNFSRGYGEELSLEDGSAQAVYDAVILDAREGNIPGPPVLPGDEGYAFDCHIDFEYRVRGSEGVHYENKGLELYPTMAHTIDALLDLELLTPERLAEMKQDFIDRYGEEALSR